MTPREFTPTRGALRRKCASMRDQGFGFDDIDAEVERQVSIRVEQEWHAGSNGKPDIRRRILVELGLARWCSVCRIGNGKQPSVGYILRDGKTEECWGCGGDKVIPPK